MGTIQQPLTGSELRQRINTYFLAIGPLLKIAMRIEQTQPIVSCLIKDDGYERIEQSGWSEEAKEMYAIIEREIEGLRKFYFGEATNQGGSGHVLIDGRFRKITPQKEKKAMYKLLEEDAKRLFNDFTYHAPKETQPQRYEELRAKAKEFAELILLSCPNSRERSLAITKVEEAVFWANAAIARNE